MFSTPIQPALQAVLRVFPRVRPEWTQTITVFTGPMAVMQTHFRMPGIITIFQAGNPRLVTTQTRFLPVRPVPSAVQKENDI